jgi:hypothetical protein
VASGTARTSSAKDVMRNDWSRDLRRYRSRSRGESSPVVGLTSRMRAKRSRTLTRMRRLRTSAGSGRARRARCRSFIVGMVDQGGAEGRAWRRRATRWPVRRRGVRATEYSRGTQSKSPLGGRVAASLLASSDLLIWCRPSRTTNKRSRKIALVPHKVDRTLTVPSVTAPARSRG